MEENYFLNQHPQNQKQDHFSRLAFYKVGIIEVGILAIILLLTAGILNYFNILPFSEMFPKYLSFLPRKTVEQNYTPIATPTPSGPFQYDIKKAEKFLTQYIKDEIKSELLPQLLDIKQGQSIDGRLEETKYQFGLRFSANDAVISAVLHLKENTNQPNDYTIFAESTSTANISVTASLANSLLGRYFKNPYPIKDCQTKTATSYCENFQILKEGKKGYGIVFIRDEKPILIVFNCFMSKERKDYDTTKSCISPW